MEMKYKIAYVLGNYGGFNLNREDIKSLKDIDGCPAYRMKTIRMAAEVINELWEEVQRCHRRLEIDKSYIMRSFLERVEPMEIPFKERKSFPDKIKILELRDYLIEESNNCDCRAKKELD